MKRLTLALTLLLGAVPMAHAQYQCNPTATKEGFMEELGAELERVQGGYKASETARQARIHGHAQALVAAGAWTEQERSDFFASLLKDPEFDRYEQEKKKILEGYMSALQQAITLAETDTASACPHAINTVGGLQKIADASHAQYTLMEDRLEQVAKAKGVTLPATP